MTQEITAEHRAMVERLQKPGVAIVEHMSPLRAATLHMGVGVCTEAGELLDAFKKWVFYGKPLDVTNVVEELGDIEFYLEGIRQNLGITREQTLEANVNKLLAGKNARYADGYSDAAAIARADKADAEISKAEQSDPVENHGTYGWGFWDETWSVWHGGYADEAAARAGLDAYAKELEGPLSDALDRAAAGSIPTEKDIASLCGGGSRA